MLKFPEELKQLSDPHTFRQWLYHEVPKEWGGLFQTALCRTRGSGQIYRPVYPPSRHQQYYRIIAEKDGNIEFWFKNTKKKSRWETTSLPVATFIERFLYHVLPKQFHRIRYYGILANGKAGATIETVRRDLAEESDERVPPEEVQDVRDRTCPKCNKGTMITILIIDGYGNIIAEKLAGNFGADTLLNSEGYMVAAESVPLNLSVWRFSGHSKPA